MSRDSIDKLASKLAEVVPESLKSVRDDLEQSFRSILSSGIGKLDLVSREEFEVQQAVLLRTREKLEALEQRLASLELEPNETAAKKAKKKKTKKKKSSKKTS